MDHKDAGRVLDEVGVLRHRSDLDLLIFFARHPCALLTSEQLAAFLGYELAQIAESLEMLLDAKLLTRTQNRNHAARLYVFAASGNSGGWRPLLAQLASTREGRLALLEALAHRPARNTTDTKARSRTGRMRSVRATPFIVPRGGGATRGRKAG